MEDVKEQSGDMGIIPKKRKVSILVLMEDVKEPVTEMLHLFDQGKCFNPCFNGRCKRTTY